MRQDFIIRVRNMTLSSKCAPWISNTDATDAFIIQIRNMALACECTWTHVTLSTEIATPPKSTKSRNLDFSVSRGTDSHWDFDKAPQLPRVTRAGPNACGGKFGGLSVGLSGGLPSHMWMHVNTYDTFHWNWYTPKIHQIYKIRFLDIRGTNSNWDFGWARGGGVFHAYA